MKISKLFFLVLVFFVPNVFAKENVKQIDYVYMNAQVDILGSIHVKEAIITDEKDLTIPIVYKPYTKKNTKNEIENTTFYNARNVSVKCAKSFKVKSSDINFKLLDNSCEDAKSTSYKVTDKKNRKIISIRGEDNNLYIVDYFIDQALVVHKDIAELYFPFINDYDYDIKKANIQVVLSGYTKTFKFYSHSNGKGSLSPIGEKEKKEYLYKGVILKLKNIPHNTSTDVRLLFDKNITGISEKLLNNSNQKSYDRIVKLENKKISDTKKKNQLKSVKKVLSKIVVVGYIILGFTMFYLYMKGGLSKKTIIFYLVLGALIVAFCMKNV